MITTVVIKESYFFGFLGVLAHFLQVINIVNVVVKKGVTATL